MSEERARYWREVRRLAQEQGVSVPEARRRWREAHEGGPEREDAEQGPGEGEAHGGIRVSGRARVVCPFCRDDLLPEDEQLACGGCATGHHLDCLRELEGRCATRGCGRVLELPPRPVTRADLEELDRDEPARARPPEPAPPPLAVGNCRLCSGWWSWPAPVLVCTGCLASYHERCWVRERPGRCTCAGCPGGRLTGPEGLSESDVARARGLAGGAPLTAPVAPPPGASVREEVPRRSVGERVEALLERLDVGSLLRRALALLFSGGFGLLFLLLGLHEGQPVAIGLGAVALLLALWLAVDRSL